MAAPVRRSGWVGLPDADLRFQNRIDSLTTDFVNRDDPAQQSQIRADREKALAELDRVKKVVEEDRRAIPELEEEARREGVPAGWLR